MRELTSLSPLSDDGEDGQVFTGGVYVNGLTTQFSKIFRRHTIVLSPNSGDYKMKTLLGSTKDKLNKTIAKNREFMRHFAVTVIRFILDNHVERVKNVLQNTISLIMGENCVRQRHPII